MNISEETVKELDRLYEYRVFKTPTPFVDLSQEPLTIYNASGIFIDKDKTTGKELEKTVFTLLNGAEVTIDYIKSIVEGGWQSMYHKHFKSIKDNDV